MPAKDFLWRNGKVNNRKLFSRFKETAASQVVHQQTSPTRAVQQITQSRWRKSYDPQWSPDGKRIVYYFEKGDAHDQVWLTDANGSFHTNVTKDTTTHNYFPSWIDDKTIIYTRSPGELMMMDADGSSRQKIEGVNATPVKYNAKARKLIYIKSEEENKLMLYDWQTKTAMELLEGTILSQLF
jgi:Tol biopolymer transport system component